MINKIFRYVNFLTFMQIINIIELFKIITGVDFELSWNWLYGIILFSLPFLANLLLQIHIKKYDNFYSRDVLMMLIPTIYSGLFLCCLIVMNLTLGGR